MSPPALPGAAAVGCSSRGLGLQAVSWPSSGPYGGPASGSGDRGENMVSSCTGVAGLSVAGGPIRWGLVACADAGAPARCARVLQLKKKTKGQPTPKTNLTPTLENQPNPTLTQHTGAAGDGLRCLDDHAVLGCVLHSGVVNLQMLRVRPDGHCLVAVVARHGVRREGRPTWRQGPHRDDRVPQARAAVPRGSKLMLGLRAHSVAPLTLGNTPRDLLRQPCAL